MTGEDSRSGPILTKGGAGWDSLITATRKLRAESAQSRVRGGWKILMASRIRSPMQRRWMRPLEREC